MITVKPLLVDSCAWYPYSDALWEKLARKDRFDEPYTLGTRVVGGYKPHHGVVGDLIGVPRELCDFPWRGTSLDMRADGKDIPDYGFCKFGPRNPKQFDVIKESCALLTKDSSHVIEGSTGFGKTYCAINIAVNMGKKTLVVVNKNDQMQAWHREIQKFFDVPDSEIGIIQQGKCKIEGKSFVIGMVHSLAQREYEFDLSEFGLIVFDEVHHMAAETFSRVAAMFPAKLRLGISATPERSDRKEGLFYGHIGKPMVKAKLLPMPPKILVQHTGWKLPRVQRRDSHGNLIRIQMPHEAGKLTHIFKAMAQDGVRNRLIVSLAVQAYKKGRWTIVMSELAEERHLGILREMCKQAGVPDTDMAFYKGGMSEKAREEAKTKRLCFVTYRMTSEATDVPWWDLAILATPLARVMQAAGRVCRYHPGKPQPVIIDLVDDDSAILEGYFKSRLKQYTSSEMKGEVIYL